MCNENVYFKTCREEVEQAIDCSDVLCDKSFYDIAGEKSDVILSEMANELYNCAEAKEAFQLLAETAQLIANKKLKSIIDETN